MVLTVQEAIEQARIKEKLESRGARVVERATRIAKEDIRKEGIEKFKRAFAKRKVSPIDIKTGAMVRKAISLVAPKGGMVRRITTTKKEKVPGRGRGRPKKSYKLRYVPGIGTVRVPTHIYNKMMAEVKAKRRLVEAQRQAEAEQLAMTQDPRYQPSAEDAWVESEDFEHEADVQRVKQQQLIRQQMYQQQQVQRPTVAKRAGEMFGKVKLSLMETARPQQYQPGYAQPYPQRPQVQPYPAPRLDMERHRPISPQVIVLGGKSPMFGGKGNIMDQRTEINRPEESTIGFGK